MKIDLNAAIKNLDGSNASFEETEITVRRILVDTLMMQHKDDVEMSGKEKVRLIKLALKIEGCDDDEFTAEDVAFLVSRVDKICPPLTVYRIREILDPANL